MEKVHNMRTTATQKNREVQGVPKHLNRTPRQKVPEEFHESSSSRQPQNQVPRTCNKTNMLWSSAAGYFHMALPSFSWPLAAPSLDHRRTLVQIKCMTFQDIPKRSKTSQNRTVKNSQQGELQNHDNCENCCIHRPMSPHVSNCM